MPFWSANTPPMFFAYGQEKLTDEGLYVSTLARHAITATRQNNKSRGIMASAVVMLTGSGVGGDTCCTARSSSANEVHFWQYDALPHIFYALFPQLPQSRHVMEKFAAFCSECLSSSEANGEGSGGKGRVKVQGLNMGVCPSPDADPSSGPRCSEYVLERMPLTVRISQERFEARLAKMRARQAERKDWKGPTKISGKL